MIDILWLVIALAAAFYIGALGEQIHFRKLADKLEKDFEAYEANNVAFRKQTLETITTQRLIIAALTNADEPERRELDPPHNFN